MQTGLDHLLLGIDNLDRGIAWVEEKTGIRVAFGGVHPGRGTRNALLALGPDCYLEIIAPDPEQNSPTWFAEILTFKQPRLLTWAAHTADLEGLAKRAVAAGIQIDGPHGGARSRPDGRTLSWKLFHLRDNHSGLLPFLIEWGHGSIHPATDAPRGCRLIDFHLESAGAADLSRICRALGIEVAIKTAAGAGLHALISSPRGDVELTS
jgi:hypothetical protein